MVGGVGRNDIMTGGESTDSSMHRGPHDDVPPSPPMSESPNYMGSLAPE